ncbi:MAG TPA: DUF5777 family beta-barrel protein [Salinibacter sp.]|nr:DUF5777 family beta-barrel protein [Salinibacter sp.]
MIRSPLYDLLSCLRASTLVVGLCVLCIPAAAGQEARRPDASVDPGAGLDSTAGPSASPDTTTSPEHLMPFSGWKVINLPTDRTLAAGNWLFLIGHRFNSPVNVGYSGFYGLDSGATMYLSLGYAFTDRLLATLARSDLDDNVELEARYGLVHETNPNWPVGLAVQGTVNWLTVDRPGQRRWRAAAFKYTGQLTLTRTVADRIGLAVVPGVTLNPSEGRDGEGALATLGLGARWKVEEKVALVGEWTPVLAGPSRIRSSRYHTWAAGVELTTAGHVFQIVMSNGLGLTTDQYLRGGSLNGNVLDGNVRLGFNIFRILDFSKF